MRCGCVYFGLIEEKEAHKIAQIESADDSLLLLLGQFYEQFGIFWFDRLRHGNYPLLRL
jgi:hypothetical protein